jgi:hypothetical protein
MSATTILPAWNRPGATTSPTLRPWNVTVRSASTAAPSISPVEASTPEGRSTDTTGALLAFIRSIAAAASGRGAPWNPVPKSASRTTSAPAKSSVSTTSRPASRRIRAAILPSPPLAPPPHTAAIRRASGCARRTSTATAAPARSISSPADPGYPGYRSSAARISAEL